MPQYRVYLSEGRQIDIDAVSHRAITPPDSKQQLIRVDFLDANGNVIASFSAAALHGYTKTENLVQQKDS